VIHTNDAKSAALGALVKRVRGAAVALVHTRRVSYALRRATAGKYRVADRVVAVSREIAETVQAAGVLPERVEVVHSGIDPAGYPRARERGARLTFGMVGALTPQKGHAVFLRALAELARRGGAGDWDALVVGDGPLRGEMIELARTLGLSDRVRFAGFVESREALAAMDVLCVPSVDGEGSSGAIKEGWVTGLPVVCSDLASNLELVEPGVSGLAFARGDAEGLADGLARVCLDAGLAERLARAGAGRARAFTDEAMAARYMAIYREIAG
jgi:glycosyltransferase involved in cell wall biosynthesis